MAIHSQFNADLTALDRTYTASIGWKIFAYLLGGGIAIAGLLGAWYFGTGHEMRSVREAIGFSVLSLMFCLLGAYTMISVLTFRVTLRPESVEMKACFSAKTMQRRQIAGYRLIPTRNVDTLVLVPSTRESKKLRIPVFMKIDSAFEEWLDRIPNLDHQERASAEAELANNLELGVSPDQREANLDAARRISKALNAVTLITGFWGLMYPYPRVAVVAVLVLVPVIAALVLLRSKGIYSVEGQRNDPRPTLVVPMMLPGLVLARLTTGTTQVVAWQSLLAAAMLLGCAFTVVLLKSDRSLRKRPGILMVMFACGAAYGYGAIAQVARILS